jgi:NAD(P)H dehydrogenase (quinone)
MQPKSHDGAVYEISGPELFSFQQIAAMAAEAYAVPIEYVSLTPEQRFEMFDAMGVPRKYSENMQAHPDAHMWCSEEMVTADIAFAQDFHAILSHHVQFITGKKPYALREVFEFCKGKDYGNC